MFSILLKVHKTDSSSSLLKRYGILSSENTYILIHIFIKNNRNLQGIFLFDKQPLTPPHQNLK